MEAKRLGGGKILAPFTVSAEGDPSLIGHGMAELAEGDPGYATWDEWLKLTGQ